VCALIAIVMLPPPPGSIVSELGYQRSSPLSWIYSTTLLLPFRFVSLGFVLRCLAFSSGDKDVVEGKVNLSGEQYTVTRRVPVA